VLEFEHERFDQFTTMGSHLKTSVLVGFLLLLLLPAMVYCQLQPRFVLIAVFTDKNCTSELPFAAYGDLSEQPTATFPANVFNASETFESAILTNVTGNVNSLVACQAALPCNATGAFQISFNLSDVGVCSTAGPAGTQFDKFLLS